jgi:hypothetical protein
MSKLSGYENVIGQRYVFADGDWLEVKHIKWRGDDEFMVGYLVQQGPGIPRNLVQSLPEFLGNYGHLFGIGEPPEPRE